MEPQESQGAELVPFTTRLTKLNRYRLKMLVAWEGSDIEKVTNQILDLFFSQTGEIPERKSLLESWPGPAPKLKKPRK